MDETIADVALGAAARGNHAADTLYITEVKICAGKNEDTTLVIWADVPTGATVSSGAGNSRGSRQQRASGSSSGGGCGGDGSMLSASSITRKLQQYWAKRTHTTLVYRVHNAETDTTQELTASSLEEVPELRTPGVELVWKKCRIKGQMLAPTCATKDEQWPDMDTCCAQIAFKMNSSKDISAWKEHFERTRKQQSREVLNSMMKEYDPDCEKDGSSSKLPAPLVRLHQLYYNRDSSAGQGTVSGSVGSVGSTQGRRFSQPPFPVIGGVERAAGAAAEAPGPDSGQEDAGMLLDVSAFAAMQNDTGTQAGAAAGAEAGGDASTPSRRSARLARQQQQQQQQHYGDDALQYKEVLENSGFSPSSVKTLLVENMGAALAAAVEAGVPPSDKQIARPPEQRTGCYAGFGSSSSRRSSSGALGSNSVLDPLLMVDSLAMPGGQTDVYAYLIYSTFRASTPWQLAQAVLGMVVTFLMQLGIVVLLWFGVISSMHRTPITYPHTAHDGSWRTVVSSVEMPLAVVNMLVIFALAVYALEEIRKAVNLSITAAACIQILPRFYLGESFSTCSAAGKGLQAVCYGRWGRILTPVLRMLVLAAPLCQHLIGLLVLISGIDLTFLRTNTDIVQIILDAAALIFLLELDSRVGTVLFEQHLRSVPSMKSRALSRFASSNSSSSFSSLPRTAADVAGSGGGGGGGGGFGSFSKMVSMGQGKLSCRGLSAVVRMRLGHVYIALVGLMVLLQPLFLSSISMLGIHTSFMVSNLLEWKANRGPLTLWTLYGAQGLCITNSPSLLDNSALLLPVVYPILVAAMVLLLCGNMLPSMSHYWSLTMLTAQVTIGLAPHVLACGPRSALLLLPVVVVVAWVVLFVAWPVWWDRQDAKQQEGKLQQQQEQQQQQQHAVVDVPSMADSKVAGRPSCAEVNAHIA
ncbi:hypothetical protein OEZ85_009089 [Tetradesmus obliquus]|uniref:UBA domain-containing protein n=1 Tax=Tetradesmus obliquus TaxID=3088 RepID=A0ABY8TKQ6_TETOB|nr:hypothetical protein OEZ85_009089 [Tetradesmus obliquus]